MSKETGFKQVTSKNGRYYEYDGERYPSVTSILSKGIPKPGLIKWAGKLVAEHAVYEADKWADMENSEAIEYLSSRPDARRNSSANLGSVIHAAVDAYSNGRPFPEVDDKAAAYLRGFEQFVRDHSPKYLMTERFVFNKTHKYGGTLDAMAIINRTAWVLDTKTGNRVYPEVALQLAAYKNAEYTVEDGETIPLRAVKRGGVLHLQPDGYELIPVRVDEEIFEAFLSVKDVYDWSENLSRVVIREPITKAS